MRQKVVDGKPPPLWAGWQTAWMIIEFFKTDRHRTSFTSYSDLQSLPWLGDTPTDMENVLRIWDYLLKHLDMPALPEEQLRNLFYETYEEPKVLAIMRRITKESERWLDQGRRAPLAFCGEPLRCTS